MAVSVFVVGRPGSGKSATVRYLFEFAQRQHLSAVRVNDYDILYSMFLKDTGHNLFRSTEYGGFDIIEPSVRERALLVLEQKVREESTQRGEILIIELGRPNYVEAFELFSDDLLLNAHFLFVAADLNICLKRTRERVIHRKTCDDYFVAESIVLSRYSCPYVPPFIRGKRVTMIDNTGSSDELKAHVEAFAQHFIEQDKLLEEAFAESLPQLDATLTLA